MFNVILDGCRVCGQPSLASCDRCGQAVCASHAIVSEPGLMNPGRSERFCLICWKNRGGWRKLSDLVDAGKLLWNLAVILALLVGIVIAIYSWIVGK